MNFMRVILKTCWSLQHYYSGEPDIYEYWSNYGNPSGFMLSL